MRTVPTIKANCEHLFKEIIHLRDGYCQWCKGGTGCSVLQVHHIIPRSRSAVLFYDLLNLILLCRDCHTKYGKDQAAGIRWFETKFPVRWEYLHHPIVDEWGKKLPRRFCVKSSWKKADYEQIEESLKQKLKELNHGH
jgi:hypothetical protein